MPQGIIYRNICFYRIAMNLLYGFAYKKRFRQIEGYIRGTKVVELCFGDLYIANFCRGKNYFWQGYDINKGFVKRAEKKKFSAVCCDLKTQNKLPENDTCIIIGSLYHFNKDSEYFYNLIFEPSKRVIISEPIKNLSSKKGVLGYLASIHSDAGSGSESFRHTMQTLLKSIENPINKFNFTIAEKQYFKKDIILVLDKKIR